MKKKIILLIIGLFVASFLVGCANNSKTTINNVTEYKFEDKSEDYYTDGLIFESNMVVNYLGADEVVYIPSTYNGVEITEIASGVFTDTMVTSVHMFDSIKTIDEQAFKNASHLTNIVFSSNIEYIGYEALANTPWLEKQEADIYIGKTLYGFKNTLTEEPYVVKEETVYISPCAFENQENLKEINLSNVKKIGFSCFRNCPNLENITVSDDFISAGSGSLVDTKWFENKSVGPYYLGNCLCGFKGDMMPQENVLINDGVTAVSENAFYSAKQMSKIQLPDTIKYIGDSAFEGCILLVNLVLPQSLIEIGEKAFYGCEKLTTIELPATTKIIKKQAFSNTTITQMTFNEGLEVIGDNAFENSLIKNIQFPKSLKTIGDNAFTECKKLKTVVIPDDSELTSIGTSAFSYCQAMTSFTFGNNSKVDVIKEYTFRKDLKLSSFDISNTGIKEIGKGAFYGCEALESFSFNDQIKALSDNLFSDCILLTTLNFNNTQIESVGEMTFSGCTSLKTVTLPESTKTIKKYAFLESGLESFNVGSNIELIEEEAFSLSNVSEFTVGNNNNYKEEGGVLFTKDGKTLVAYPIGSTNTEYVIDNVVETIYVGAFMGASNLVTITVGSSVTKIDAYAFSNMKALTSIIMLCTTPPKLGSKVFNENNAKIKVPSGTLETYQNSWKTYLSKIEEQQ